MIAKVRIKQTNLIGKQKGPEPNWGDLEDNK